VDDSGRASALDDRHEGDPAAVGPDELVADHLLLVEWPDRFAELPARECWRVTLAFEDEARAITVQPPEIR